MTADSNANRFFSFWGALATFFAFGLLALVLAGVNLGGNPERRNPDDERRATLDSEALAAQRQLVTTWKKNDDGTYEVPIEVALPKMVDKFSKAEKSAVPAPGTKAAEEAAQAAADAAADAAAAAAAEAASSEGNETQAPADGDATQAPAEGDAVVVPAAEIDGSKAPD